MARKTKAADHLVNRKTKARLVDEIAASHASATKPPAKQQVNENGVRCKPFRFFGLPSELRLRIYEVLLTFPTTIDLDPVNHSAIAPQLRVFLVSHRFHEEASRVFYSCNTFRIFPTHGRYINRKHPLLAWFPRRYRGYITRVELRLGPGFTRPPKHWIVDSRLGLAAATNLHKLRVFVEIDPASHVLFEAFGLGQAVYTEYCVGLLRALLVMPGPRIKEVEFDAYPSVKRDGPLLTALVQETRLHQKTVAWGSERVWEDGMTLEIERAMRTMRVG